MSYPDSDSYRDMQDRSYDIARRHGWWDKEEDRNVPTKLALMAGELVGEALEEYRENPSVDYLRAIRYSSKLRPEYEVVSSHQLVTDQTPIFHLRVVGRGPLEQEDHLDVRYGDPKYFDNKPIGFAVELADAVIRIQDLCGWLSIDLATVIRLKQDYNNTRPYRHGGKTV